MSRRPFLFRYRVSYINGQDRIDLAVCLFNAIPKKHGSLVALLAVAYLDNEEGVDVPSMEKADVWHHRPMTWQGNGSLGTRNEYRLQRPQGLYLLFLPLLLQSMLPNPDAP